MDAIDGAAGRLASPFLTIREAARFVHVSESHMRRLVERGEVEAVHVGPPEGRKTPVRIPVEALLAYLYGTQLPEQLPPVSRADLEPWITA